MYKMGWMWDRPDEELQCPKCGINVLLSEVNKCWRIGGGNCHHECGAVFHDCNGVFTIREDPPEDCLFCNERAQHNHECEKRDQAKRDLESGTLYKEFWEDIYPKLPVQLQRKTHRLKAGFGWRELIVNEYNDYVAME